jgi:hypothetical protein
MHIKVYKGMIRVGFMELNRTYILRLTIDGRLLTYTGKILSIDENFVTFLDKFDKKISVNKKNIESYEEVGE